jgi:hypothetical protein
MVGGVLVGGVSPRSAVEMLRDDGIRTAAEGLMELFGPQADIAAATAAADTPAAAAGHGSDGLRAGSPAGTVAAAGQVVAAFQGRNQQQQQQQEEEERWDRKDGAVARVSGRKRAAGPGAEGGNKRQKQ